MKKLLAKIIAISLALVFTFSTAVFAGEETKDAGTGDFVKDMLEGKGLKEDGTPYKVALIFGDMDSEYIIYFGEYTKYLLEKAGCEVTMSNSTVNLETEAGFYDDAIQNGCDVIITTAVDSNGSAASAKKALDAGMKLICVSRAIENVPYDLLICTCDNQDAGRKCMQYVADLAAGEEVDTICVTGSMGGTDAQARTAGYEMVVEENENISLEVNDCDWSPSKAEAAVTDALTANPDLYAVLSHSTAMTTGVKSALVQAGKLAKVGEEGHIVWTSIDGGPGDLQAIRDGYQDASCDQSPLTASIAAVKGLLNYIFAGEATPVTDYIVSTDLITAENVNNDGWWGDYDLESLQKDELWVQTADQWEAVLQ